jgi:hypothetical protein
MKEQNQLVNQSVCRRILINYQSNSSKFSYTFIIALKQLLSNLLYFK